ncbi:MAG TPA: orotidine-5'-phosphate decarboxylase [Steroidobacteraceae bacterium]
MSFASRLQARIAAHGALCVGIDPSASLLRSCGLPDTAEGALAFGERVLEAAEAKVAIVKPQSAFFERFGSLGLKALEELTALAKRQDVMVLLDGKRGDIDSTALAYAEAYFGPTTRLAVDAITTHVYLGIGALKPMFDFAVKQDRGVFVVVRSSNPEGEALQTARTRTGETVAQALCREITALNRGYTKEALGPIGAVVGATCQDAAETVEALPTSFILAPGVGAQGATMQDLRTRMPNARGRILANVSRAILANGTTVSEIRTTIKALQSQAEGL